MEVWYVQLVAEERYLQAQEFLRYAQQALPAEHEALPLIRDALAIVDRYVHTAHAALERLTLPDPHAGLHAPGRVPSGASIPHAGGTPVEQYAEGLRARVHEVAQMERQHILLVNNTPEFLDFVRVLLQEARYNVTTTNAVPLTFALIAAARPALIIIDLDLAERSGWDLLVRLHAEAITAAIPVVVTARDARLLAHAHTYPELFGGQSHLAVPFTVATMLGTVTALIGSADAA